MILDSCYILIDVYVDLLDVYLDHLESNYLLQHLKIHFIHR